MIDAFEPELFLWHVQWPTPYVDDQCCLLDYNMHLYTDLHLFRRASQASFEIYVWCGCTFDLHSDRCFDALPLA